MKKQLLFLLGLAVSAVCVQGAALVPGKSGADFSKLDAAASAWKSAKPVKVVLYPQTTVISVDRAAEATQGGKPLEAEARVLLSGTHMAIKLSWPDATASEVTGTNSYADGFAVQFPVNAKGPLPYIGMGDPRASVVVHLRKSGRGYAKPQGFDKQLADLSLNLYGDELAAYRKAAEAEAEAIYQKTFLAKGFRTMTEQPEANGAVFSDMRYKKGRYEAVIIRPIKDKTADLNRAVIPVALAVWDGDKAGRDGAKWLSSWLPIVVDEAKADQALVDNLIGTPKGDPVKGKELAAGYCAGCHNFDGLDNGMPTMAPGLHWLGGQASAEYIRESILNPSAVVVPGYNRYAHPATAWYTENKGQRTSTMPGFDYLPQEELEALVAYFKSLK